MLTRVNSTMRTRPEIGAALRDYLGQRERGAHAALARALGIDRVYLSQLVAGGRKPSPELCAAMERHSAGELTCEALRPDIEWHRVADQDWPHHPDGRPLLEVAKPEAPTDAPATGPGALDEKAAA